MDERTYYLPYSPSPHSSSHHSMRPSPSSASLERERYLAELLVERQKLVPFLQVVPFCNRLLNQEIKRISSLAHPHNFVSPERIEHGSPMRLGGQLSNSGPMDMEGWSGIQTEENSHFHRMGLFQASNLGWNGAPAVATSPAVKKVVRLDIPTDKFPTFNFVGRLLGPRGNSLKRVEATTKCRVYIRGRGSVKDAVKEEKLRDKPGYEHLNEPLHVLVEAEFPAEMIDGKLSEAVRVLEELLKPVDESQDYYKKEQLRELAVLNGNLREGSPCMSPSQSPFNSTGMKRAKTGQ